MDTGGCVWYGCTEYACNSFFSPGWLQTRESIPSHIGRKSSKEKKSYNKHIERNIRRPIYTKIGKWNITTLKKGNQTGKLRYKTTNYRVDVDDGLSSIDVVGAAFNPGVCSGSGNFNGGADDGGGDVGA